MTIQKHYPIFEVLLIIKGNKMKTRKQYEQYLNEIAPDYDSENWIIGGKRRRGNYGAAIRKYDPIAFNVGYGEWK